MVTIADHSSVTADLCLDIDQFSGQWSFGMLVFEVLLVRLWIRHLGLSYKQTLNILLLTNRDN